MRLSLVLGVALILGMVVVWDRHEVFPAELDQRSSEGFAKAAHGARSWAEKAFGAASAPDSSFSGQQKLSQTQSDLDSHDRAIRGARDRTASRHVSIKAPMLSDSGSFSRSSDDRALEERNHEDLSMSGESKGFYADAMSELPPAPHLSSLRGTKQPVSFSDDAMESLRSVHREASTSESAEGKTVKLADLGGVNDSEHKRGRFGEERQFSLAPERREGSYAKAQDFGSMIARLREEREDKETVQKAESDQIPVSARNQVVTGTVAKARRAQESYDSFGIPNGTGEGFHVTKYLSSVGSRRKQIKTVGISGRQADTDISSYFSSLVNQARQAKRVPMAHHYFATKGYAREAMLAEESSTPGESEVVSNVKSVPARETALHPNWRKTAPGQGATVPVESVKKAVAQIRDEALTAEKAILREATAAKRAIAHAKAVQRGSSQPTLTFPTEEISAKTHQTEHTRLFHSFQPGSMHQSALRQHHSMSGQAAREALLSSMNVQFSQSRVQDRLDSEKLHVMDHKTANEDLTSFLSQEASKTSRQDRLDEERLARRGRRKQDLVKKEKNDSLEQEREYESALRDALNNGALPHMPA